MFSCIIFRWRPLYVCVIGRPKWWAPVALCVVQVELRHHHYWRRDVTYWQPAATSDQCPSPGCQRHAWGMGEKTAQSSIGRGKDGTVEWPGRLVGVTQRGWFWCIKGLPRSDWAYLSSQLLRTTVGFVWCEIHVLWAGNYCHLDTSRMYSRVCPAEDVWSV